MGSSIEAKARFRSAEEASAALKAIRAEGTIGARCSSEDSMDYELDFVQHPVATSIAAIVACTVAGVTVGVGFDVFSPGASLWLATAWAVPAISALGGAALGASIAFVICRTALREYRDTRQMTVVVARVRPEELTSVRTLMQRQGALEFRSGVETPTRHAA